MYKKSAMALVLFITFPKNPDTVDWFAWYLCNSACCFAVQVLCSRILQQRHPLHPALLMNPPRDVEDELTTLLARCSEYDQMNTDLYILNGLRDVQCT